MNSPAQRVNIGLEHVSAISDYDEEGYEDSWLVVAYLDFDREKRERVTLHRCNSRSEASAALESIWGQVTAARAQRTRAA